MAIPNPLEALVVFLKADAAVAALVDTRVYGAELPPSEATAQPRKCVVVTASGGGGAGPGDRSYMRVARIRFDVKAYAETPYAAWEVHLATLDALKHMERSVNNATLLHNATISGGPNQLRDPDLDWPLVFSVYELTVAEVAVT